ncbi:MAG: hypothetical protein U0746_18780 [Gemmataceae bacterium]
MPKSKSAKARGNAKAVRDAWLAEIERFFAEVEAWARKQGWATLRDYRPKHEEGLGDYRVPVLLVHTLKGRVLFTPEARYVYGADGRIDACVYPSFDDAAMLVKTNGWGIRHADRDDDEPWTEASFVRVVNEALDQP